ncbi:MAG TPA: T9SS type A sorting domain-containing protein [Flavipsychrobacter sp.]|nr:T9SS type A sorting domain-containing protein [Flavipsychrobacter sp.]
MKKILLSFAACFSLCATSFAQVFTQDFEGLSGGALPSGWVQGHPSGTIGWQTGTNSSLDGYYFNAAAHTTFAAVSEYYDSGKNINDTLFTPTFSLTGLVHPYLKFDNYFTGYFYNPGGPYENASVLISTDGGDTWSFLDSVRGVGSWTTQYIDLNSFTSSSTVKLAWRYTDNGRLLGGVGIDNVSVYLSPSVDMGISAVYPTATGKNSITSYQSAGTNLIINGYVFNNSYNPVTSYNINFVQGDGSIATVSMTPSPAIGPYSLDTFTATTPYVFPSAVGSHPSQVWVSIPGDVNPANDTMGVSFYTVGSKPTKKLAIEEATGIWCGFCPRGKVFADSIVNAFGNNISIISVHNQAASVGRYDPLEIPAYDNFITSNYFGPNDGFPSFVLDRRETFDPSYIFDYYNLENSYFGFADVAVGTPTISGSTLSTNVTITPAINLNGDYRVALVITEDKVHHSVYSSNLAPDPDGEWNQENYYSTANPYGGSVGYLAETGFDYTALPFLIPDTIMYYDYTARSISDLTGAAHGLPSSMTAGTAYPITLTGSVSSNWNPNNLKAVVLFIDGSDTVILNSNSAATATAIANVNSGIEEVRLFPNPAQNFTNVVFNLTESTNVQIQVTDMVGRVVYLSPDKQMNAGENKVTISTTDMASGLYNVKITSDQGNVIQRFSVVK